MTSRTIARRYAAALFDVTHKAGTEERAGRDLAAVAALVAGHDQLRKVLETPALPLQKKKALFEAIVAREGGPGVETQRMLSMLADRDRLMLLADVAQAFADRLLEAKRVVPAEVVTAVPLAEERRAALAKALGKATGSQVMLTARVDPSIIGGVVAKVGSVLLDGSITRQLERLGQRLRTES